MNFDVSARETEQFRQFPRIGIEKSCNKFQLLLKNQVNINNREAQEYGS